MTGGQQALLAQWTAAATEARQGREEARRLREALAARDLELSALQSAILKESHPSVNLLARPQ